MSFGFRIVQDDFTPKLADAPEKIKQFVTERMAEVGAEMMSYSRSIVPVRTGWLRSTIFFQIAQELEAQFGAAATYGIFVEMGTWRMAARPFIRPALDAYHTKLLTAILQGVLEVFK
mgnify:CR=1 FL=1